MIKTFGALRVHGESFFPEVAEKSAGIPFSEKQKPGEVATRGPHRGRPRPYGSGELNTGDGELDLQTPNCEFFDSAEKLAKASTAAGATDVLLHIDVAFKTQCNLEMSPAFLDRLHRLGLPVTMTCYEDESI